MTATVTMTVSTRLHRPARRLALLASSLLLLGALSGCEKTPAPSFKSLDITGAEYARQLSLTDANGQPFQLSSLKGKVAVVFFGDKLVGVFVTVDPKRDTAALLKAYVGAFNPNWVGLRGTPEETAAAAKEFKIFYREVPGKTESSYTVDHTAASFVFDP